MMYLLNYCIVLETHQLVKGLCEQEFTNKWDSYTYSIVGIENGLVICHEKFNTFVPYFFEKVTT